ncbi:GGDEF domain-containing protein [Thiomicrorhabdus sp. Milos-T2]|uniref:GGDEF domain-containing protein n=1 Tax=Thiomicrorhabdus sp. Milos-T2 TaxID=90814 RepID=UPI0004944BF9|nr:GGDEF domain-containing protein [Thiomicrorhabdus sp. Milos-T2]
MPQFKRLQEIKKYIDPSFETFYDAMLNNERMSVFFDSNEQIKELIVKQKSHFLQTLHLGKEELKRNYIQLGEFHYKIRVPYIDFIKATEILEEHFIVSSQKAEPCHELMDEIFEYFKIMRAFTAKGYLNKMLEEDEKDLDLFLDQAKAIDNHYLPKEVIFKKLEWLKNLLIAISKNDSENHDLSHEFLYDWAPFIRFLTPEKQRFFTEMEKRVIINTENLFFFLKREEYLEILPLYNSLLSIYKLAFMLNNAITFEYASKVISDMRLDSLTHLFRKDSFEDIIRKEISFANRDPNYCFSIAYLDLDDFKHINDHYGHYSGDKVLEMMGSLIERGIRNSDYGFRIGGDEFAILLKQANKAQANDICQKIQTEFNQTDFLFNEEISFNCTCSIGIKEYSQRKVETYETLIQEVDSKLYQSKNNGKNQIQN